MISQIRPFKAEVDKAMDVVLAASEQALTKGQPEGLLGDFVADLLLKKVNGEGNADVLAADFCVLNNGGLRTNFPKGTITKRNVFELMPFDNELYVLTLDGKKVKELFGFIGSKGGVPVSGVRMKLKDKVPRDIAVNGVPFNENRSYKVLTSDYLAFGGDKMDFFKNAIRTEALNKKIRDVIIEYLLGESKAGRTVNAQLDGRISYDK